MVLPSLESVLQAQNRIRSFIHKTPVLTSNNLNALSDCSLYFKCENLQKTGSFKIRGAGNALFSTNEDELSNGVATHSSGNHAAALACAAKIRGICASVIMPENSNPVKMKAVQSYGANIITCAPTLQSRESTLLDFLHRTGAMFIPPYDDFRIICGQGTAANELIAEVNDLDCVIVPVGGGGLLSGTAIAAKGLKPKIRVFGAEPENADDAYQSFKLGRRLQVKNPDTVADGLRTSLGKLNFKIIHKYVDDIFLVSEKEIITAMYLIWERMKILIEPSSAVPLAAILRHGSYFKATKTGVILSGGNVDIKNLPNRKNLV